MINIDFSTAVAIFLTFTLLIVFIPWIFYNYFRKEDWDYESPYVKQCPYCTYIFFHYDPAQFVTCPRCHSLIQEEGRQDHASAEKDESEPTQM